MVPPKTPQIEIDLAHCGIEESRIRGEAPADVPIDVIAIGHYRSVHPNGADSALDEAISLDFGLSKKETRIDGGILTLFGDHGVLPVDLGRVFLLPDPRDLSHKRVIAI